VERLPVSGLGASFGPSWGPSFARSSDAPADTTPDAFTFPTQFGVATSTERTSVSVEITGIDAPVECTVANGEISINGDAFTAGPVNVTEGDNIRLRHTSSGSAATAVTTTATINGVIGQFTSVTAGAGGGSGGGAVVVNFRRRRR
jgi:hypothetical protein